MSSAIKKQNGSAVDEHEDDDRPNPSAAARPQAGFFSIYKKGQGYWTRMGTVLGAAILITVTAVFAYQQATVYFTQDKTIPAAITGGVVVLGAIIAFWLMNKPANVDFLIATDAEMKKVNWTSRRELFGSTKIVIIFMFLIALLLFAIDVITGLVFQLIGLLRFGPMF